MLMCGNTLKRRPTWRVTGLNFKSFDYFEWWAGKKLLELFALGRNRFADLTPRENDKADSRKCRGSLSSSLKSQVGFACPMAWRSEG